MQIEDFIKPEDVEIGEDTFRISCIPPIEALSIFPNVIHAIRDNGDIGQLMLPPELTMRLVRWSAKRCPDGWMFFDRQKAIDENLNLATLLELQIRIIRKNFDFLENGGLLKILEAGQPPMDSSQKK